MAMKIFLFSCFIIAVIVIVYFRVKAFVAAVAQRQNRSGFAFVSEAVNRGCTRDQAERIANFLKPYFSGEIKSIKTVSFRDVGIVDDDFEDAVVEIFSAISSLKVTDCLFYGDLKFKVTSQMPILECIDVIIEYCNGAKK